MEFEAAFQFSRLVAAELKFVAVLFRLRLLGLLRVILPISSNHE